MTENNYSIPQGKKDLEVYEQAKQITINFIDELNRTGFLKKHVTIEEDALTEKVNSRVNTEAISIAKLERLFHDNKFQPFFDDTSKHGILQNDIMNFYMGLFTHQLLDVFELFKKYFVVVLDKEKLGLKGNTALGVIFHHIENKNVKHRFNEILDIELRNALGHGWYWWQNSEFYYTNDPTLKKTKKLALGELFVTVRHVSLLTRAFTDNAFQHILEIKQGNK